jgi:hypothetical protein
MTDEELVTALMVELERMIAVPLSQYVAVNRDLGLPSTQTDIWESLLRAAVVRIAQATGEDRHALWDQLADVKMTPPFSRVMMRAWHHCYLPTVGDSMHRREGL